MGATDGRHEQRAVAERFRSRLRRKPPLLYAIVDLELSPAGEVLALARALIEGRVDALQLRAKTAGPRRLAELARALLPLARRFELPLLLNDRVDVALAVGADGAHVGAEDLPAEAARRLLGPDRILGATAHSLAELESLERVGGIDYVGFGAIFPTDSKRDAPVQGVAALTAARAHTRLPLVAIGGMRPDRVAELAGSGLAGLAAASALGSLSELPGQLQAFRAALARC